MFRPRARVGHAPVDVRPAAVVPGLLLALLLGLSGCGSEDDADGSAEPSKAAESCRDEWKTLESKVGGRDARTNPSALAERWNSISATVEYYASSATAKDCDETLEGQEKSMDALGAFSLKLAPYDMELRLKAAQAGAEAYAAAPRPAAPSPSPAKKGKKAANKATKKPVANPAPKPADIAAALKTLQQQAPLATQQQGPGWQQARVVELTDAAAVAKAVKDLAFLSSESAAYRASTAALAQIRAAARAAAAAQ